MRFGRHLIRLLDALTSYLGDINPRKNQQDNIEALNYSGKIVLNLLINVLDFSKMESSGIKLNPIPRDILAAVKQIK